MHNSIRKRLTLAFIGVAVCPLLLVGAILAWQSFTAQERQALYLQRHVVQHVTAQVTAFFQELENELGIVSQAEGLHGLNRDQQRVLLSQLLAYQGVFDELVLLDDRGQEQLFLSRLGLPPSALKNRSRAEEFAIPKTTGRAYYSPMRFDQVTREPLMTISVPALDARTGLLGGVLVSVVRVKKIWDMMAEVQVEPGQSVFITDSGGGVVAHRNPSVVLRGTRFDAPGQDGINPGLTGARVVLAAGTVSLGGQAFHVVAEQVLSQALAQAIDSIIFISIAILAALLLSGGLGFLTARQITRPLRSMAAAAQAISAGDLHQQVQIARRDELGVLAQAFNSMTDQLRALIRDLEEEVAEHRRMGEILGEKEERLRVALEGTSDGIWDWDLSAGRVYFSPRYYTMLGYEPDEFPQAYESWRRLLHPEDAEIAERVVQHAIEEHSSFAIEFRFMAKNGEWRWILGRGKVVRVDENGKSLRMAGSHTDVTERKRTEEEIRRLNEQLEQRVAERTAQLKAANKEMEAFAYSISHDLRAPLRAINGFTSLLQQDYAPRLGADGGHACNVIRGETQRMSDLIDALLTLSRLGRAEMRADRIDMTAMANDAFLALTTSEDRARIELHASPLPSVTGDATLIRQVWTNLLANAIKFSARRERAVIAISAKDEGNGAVFTVRDNGVGFDMRYGGKLFGVFQRLHSEEIFEGTGVGLAIVQRIINRHGGKVWAEGAEDKGAAFSFMLPRRA